MGPTTLSQNSGVASPIRVGVIDDQAALRSALSRLLSGSGNFVCTGVYDSVESALARLAGELPDVLLIDLGLPGMTGMEGIRVIRSRWPAIVLLTLTVHEENTFIFESLCAGADGYLLKSTQPEDLLHCIQHAMDGGAPMSPSIAKKVIALFRKVRPAPEEVTELTPHEFRVLKLLADGENYKSSAKLLGVSVNTISYHVRSIYGKLHVHSRSDAVAKALRSGLIR